MPSIPVPIRVTQEVEKKVAHGWSQIFKLNQNDPHHGVRSMTNSIVIAVNERAMIQQTKLRQLRSGSRRRSAKTSIHQQQGRNVMEGSTMPSARVKVSGVFNSRRRQRPSPIFGRSANYDRVQSFITQHITSGSIKKDLLAW